MARVGGDEFAWLMPESGGMEAWRAADRAREAIAAEPFAEVGHMTISAGVCDLAQAPQPSEIFRLADGALYWAKQHGRDVAFLYSPEVVEVLSDAEQAERLTRLQALQSIRVLARAVDAKDRSTRQHSERVAEIAKVLAAELGWSPEDAGALRDAGLVHDVGKIAVPDAILFKPDRLTEAEFQRVTAHAALGAEIVADVLSADQVAWVRGHHERWDGTGYPDRLEGARIPEGARILTLADAWDVMTSERPYGVPLSREDALAECRRCSGAQFWPAAVDALERAVAGDDLPMER
jgi:putative nucleotidyltransferase with HDIG domain